MPTPRPTRPLHGVLTGFQPWTSEEDSTLAQAFAAGGASAAAAVLPQRTTRAIYHRASQLGVSRRRRWSDLDDARLRRLWDGSLTLTEVAAQLGRTVTTTYWRAQQLGLPLGVPSGWEYLTRAAIRTGYDPVQLRPILAADGGTIRRAMTKSLPPRGKARGAARRLRWIVRTAEVDAAVAAWQEAEPVTVAARRLGVCGETLARWLRAAGVKGPRGWKFQWRVTAEQVAAALAAAPKLWRGQPTVAARALAADRRMNA